MVKKIDWKKDGKRIDTSKFSPALTAKWNAYKEAVAKSAAAYKANVTPKKEEFQSAFCVEYKAHLEPNKKVTFADRFGTLIIAQTEPSAASSSKAFDL